MDINKYSYKQILKQPNILGTSNLNEPDIYEVLYTARLFKKKRAAGESFLFLQGKQVFIVCADAQFSLTAAACKSALFLAGANAVLLDGASLGSSAKYASLVIESSGAAAVIFCGFDDLYLKKYAQFSKIPVINASSRDCNPVQALTDLFTIWQLKDKLSGLKIVFAGAHATDNINSLLISSIKCGCDAVVCQDTQNILEYVSDKALQYGDYTQADSPQKTASADVLYVDFTKNSLPIQKFEDVINKTNDSAVLLCPTVQYAPKEFEQFFDNHTKSLSLQTDSKTYVYLALFYLLIKLV